MPIRVTVRTRVRVKLGVIVFGSMEHAHSIDTTLDPASLRLVDNKKGTSGGATARKRETN